MVKPVEIFPPLPSRRLPDSRQVRSR